MPAHFDHSLSLATGGCRRSYAPKRSCAAYTRSPTNCRSGLSSGTTNLGPNRASANSSGSKDRKSMPGKPMAGPVGRPEAVAQSAEVEEVAAVVARLERLGRDSQLGVAVDEGVLEVAHTG